MSSIDRLIDQKATIDSTFIDRTLGSQVLSLIPDDHKNITQRCVWSFQHDTPIGETHCGYYFQAQRQWLALTCPPLQCSQSKSALSKSSFLLSRIQTKVQRQGYAPHERRRSPTYLHVLPSSITALMQI